MVGVGLAPVAAGAAPQPVPDVAADEATAKRYAALGDKPVAKPADGDRERDPHLEVIHNNEPDPPSEMSMEGGKLPCRVGADRAFVFTRTPGLSARLSDADGDSLDGAFKLFRGPQGAFSHEYAEFHVRSIPSGSFGSAQVPEGYITADDIYTWRVRAEDRQSHTWSEYCEFEVDTARPNTPLVSSADYPTEGAHGSVGRTGNFTFQVNGNTGRDGTMDVVHYSWSLNDDGAHNAAVASEDGTVTVPITPTRPGINTLYVHAVDRAGNHSLTRAVYRFEVAAPTPASAEWKLDESSGDSAADTGQGNRPLSLSGGASFGPAYAANGMRLNGTTAVATTATPPVDTSRAFTVSAWAKLTRTDGYFTVLSQDGDRVSPFYLQYDPAVDRWRISATDRDADSPSTVSVNSLNPPEVGEWTHLLATYEPNSRNATLYVDGEPQGSVAMSFWQAGGSLVVGAARWNGDRADHFPGTVDHVQLWDRELSAAEAAEAANLAVPRARYQLDERSGSTTLDEISEQTATRSGGTSWAGDPRDSAASRKKWLNFDSSGTGEVTAPAPAGLRTDRSYTVSAWVRQDEFDHLARAAVGAGDARYSPFLLGYRPSEGKWGFLVSKSAATGDSWLALSDAPAEAGQWVHLAATYDATSGQIALYVNGTEQSSFSGTPDGTGVQSRVATGPLWIGRGIWEGQRNDVWRGDVDDVRLYSGVLSADEIAVVYSTTFHF
ncbi:LamG domain-containing protein [Saccharothrix coeruleofusca]|uniref:LamG domain-containing protein n=1 Tax=Saccharothrix coeruleofusca TaxID=33919 RepID=UPI00166FF711|nr:LamG domain-containing protein [Saccharothrix coeruleofusca]